MLTDWNYFHVEYICLHMREKDKGEVFGLLDHDDPLRLANECAHLVRNKGRGKIAWHNGRPAGLMGFVELRPSIWEVLSFGTDDYRAVAFELMRWCRIEANDILKVRDGRRLQCYSRADYDEAHKMIRAMGGLPEGPPLRKFGKDGSDYQVFTWFNGENDAILRPHYKMEAT